MPLPPILVSDKRITWLLVGVAFNTVTSLTAIALWFFAPNGGTDPSTIRPALSTDSPLSAPNPRPTPPRPLAQLPPPDPPPKGPLSAYPPPLRFDPRALSKTPNVVISTATADLAKRLTLRPEILVETLGDENGELPKDFASRLERAFEQGKAFAKRRGLDESQTQSVVALFTYYVFTVLREEKIASPALPDPARLEEITNQTVMDIRSTCGEDTSAAAERELEKL